MSIRYFYSFLIFTALNVSFVHAEPAAAAVPSDSAKSDTLSQIKTRFLIDSLFTARPYPMFTVMKRADGSGISIIPIGGTFPGDPMEVKQMEKGTSKLSKDRQIVPLREAIRMIKLFQASPQFEQATFEDLDGSGVIIKPAAGSFHDKPLEVKSLRAPATTQPSN